MIIYDKFWLDNLLIHQQTDNLHTGCITPEEKKAIKNQYPVGFNMHSLLARAGFGILTFIIVIFSTGLTSLVLADIFKNEALFLLPIFLGIGCYAMLETMVKQKNYFHSGVDEVLLWMSAAYVIGGFVWAVNDYQHQHYTLCSLFVFALSLYLSIRFADVLMSAVTCASLLSFIFFAWRGLGSFGMLTLPFALLIASVAVYIIALQLSRKLIAKYYTKCLITAQLVGLVIAYASVNYYVVQKLGSELNHLPDTAPIPFGFIFWIFTILLPFAYIGRGLVKKDTILLRLGLLLVAAAVFTFRYYHHILSAEAALTIGGSVILALTYGIIKYLKTPKHGITYAESNTAHVLDKLNVEGLIVAQTITTPVAPPDTGSRFGGGSFGGGGSSSNF
ncbi:hypothetical protein [Mucilaginibacter polytrichastri]|uniref:DUF2157 domain-containing protein n=1 Tax=Mucilaginibacter polytrichastri TaxID=1302689 RepID=A0A1Q6A5G5_9SPHI|nr:hypothetical protein [Mucilaginibacter polytrichastri]OKS89248.1 hypothetical protein RG47T_4732 [Mucilaginibacter polytrichastri]SFS75626.1 hypothetical protein SAMN04487890_103351 [Mucilaginibacter polytrichastri]